MAGMRIAIGAALMLALLAPAGAQAGTYDVVSCRAPGADGVNHAWVAQFSAYPDPNATHPDAFDIVQECPGPRTFLLARSKAQDGVDAFWAKSAGLRFDAPSRATIARIQIWRHSQVVRGDATDGGLDEWDVFAQTDDGNLTLEECVVPEGHSECNVGARPDLNGKGLVSGALATYNVDTAWAVWGVACNPNGFKSCPTANGIGYPYASANIWGSIVTIRDDVRPGLAVGGALWSDGWRRPGDALTYDAGDNAGIKSVQAQVGAVTASSSGTCDYHRPTPCGGRLTGSLAFAAAPPDGPQPATVTAVDAAGNATTATRTVYIDGNAPAADLRSPRRRKIIVGARDYASGLAAGQIAVRNAATEPYRPLPTTYRKGTLRARLDRGDPRKVDVAVTVRDNAGNEISGAPARFRITSVTSQRLRAKVRKGGRVRVKFGRKVTIRGQLVLSGRRPVAGVPIMIVTRPRVQGAPSAVEATGTVGANGRFAITLPKGPARVASITYPGGSGFIPAERRLRLMVPASSTIRASRTRLSGSGLVRFRGRVRGGADANLVVVLQGKERGRWRTFADTRTRRHGRWRASYRFSGLPGSFPVRALVRRQASLPYETGFSERVTVHVG